MDNCPFCGIDKCREVSLASGIHELFNCHNIFVQGELYDKRHITCYETELANLRIQLTRQAELLRRAAEVMTSLVFKTMRTSIGSQEHDAYRVPKGLICEARSLIPDLEKALEKVK